MQTKNKMKKNGKLHLTNNILQVFAKIELYTRRLNINFTCLVFICTAIYVILNCLCGF